MRLRLHNRIVVPLWLAVAITVATAAYVAVWFIAHTLHSRVEARMQAASAIVSRSDFALNAAILSSVKATTGADVVTFTTQGAILATTLDARHARSLVDAVTSSEGARRALLSGDRVYILRGMTCAGPCDVVYRPLAFRSDAIVAFAADTSEIDQVTSVIMRMILAWIGVALVAMVLVGYIIARRVTVPIENLVAFTHDAAPGPDMRRAAEGDDEVGRLGRAFNQMLERLERSQQSLVQSEKLGLAGLMAARVAHDIRNPLSSIKMQAQLLRRRLRDPQELAVVEAILHDVVQVESVIQNLLELARPGELKLSDTSLNDVVRDVLQQMAAQLAHRKISVTTSLDDCLPAVRLDAGRFRQALMNVVVNAAEAMHTGGTLEVATRTIDGFNVELEVCDTGVGVDQAIADRVFDAFITTKPDGVGLGLVNTKAVIESHGGRVRLMPREPKGTRVVIDLPAAPHQTDQTKLEL